MPRDLGQTNENRQADDWDRIDSEFQDRAQLQKKWDAEHDPGSEFERAARPLGPDYGVDRPRHREISPEVAAEFGRTPEELQQLRERDPRGAGRHARQAPDIGSSEHMPDRVDLAGRTPEGRWHETVRTEGTSGLGTHAAETMTGRTGADASARSDVPGRSGEHARAGELDRTLSVPDDRAGFGERAGLGARAGLGERVGADERAELGERVEVGERTGPGERAGLGERLGLDQAPPGRREAPRHLREVSLDEAATDPPERRTDEAVAQSSREPTDEQPTAERIGYESELEPARTERAYPPSWLTSADRPPPIEQTRSYNQVGHLDEPLPSEQRALEEVVPRDQQGNFERFVDPRQDWTAEVNGVGPILEPGRGSNCLDCTLSAISTWHGEPRVSAPRHAEYDPNGDPVRTGERDGPKRAERWLGHDFELVGADAATGFGEIERRMLDAGHGASAVIVNGWAPGGAHAWNAFNYEGKVYWVDSQLGDVSDRPLYPQAVDVRAIMMDGEGKQA